jgi:hypothetical protein
MALVFSQTQEVHEEVAALLAELRKVKAQQGLSGRGRVRIRPPAGTGGMGMGMGGAMGGMGGGLGGMVAPTESAGDRSGGGFFGGRQPARPDVHGRVPAAAAEQPAAKPGQSEDLLEGVRETNQQVQGSRAQKLQKKFGEGSGGMGGMGGKGAGFY